MSQGPDFPTLIARLRGIRPNQDCINIAMQAIVLAATMEDVYTIIGIVQARFPSNDPAAAPFLATARMKRNSFVPAQKLPPELLTDIFRRALPEPTFEGPDEAISNPHLFKALIDFILVCQQWKAIIDDAASLWAFLSADSASPSMLERAIEKSQSAPLVITTGKLQLDTEVFLNMVTPHIHRCRVLCCMPDRFKWRDNHGSEQQALEQFLRQPTPILEELHVAGNAGIADPDGRYIRQRIQIWVLENFAASLRVLRLVAVDWSWTPILSNLQDLQLSLLAISTAELIDCLATTTQLQSLHLSSLRDQVVAQQRVPSQSVTLPFLHQIYIENISTRFISLIISNLVPPSLKRLTLSTNSCDGPPPFTDITPYYHDLVRSIASTKTEPICIYIEDDRQWFAISDVDNDLEVVIRGVGLGNLQAKTNFTRWLAGIWNPLSSVATVALFLGSLGERDSIKLSLDRELILPLMSISNVKRLQIQENVDKVQLLYRRLSYPVLSEGGTKCWLFPKLTNLEIFGHANMELELVRMVEGRYGAVPPAAGGAAGIGPEPPAMLEQLKLWGGRSLYYSPTMFDRLRRIVGDGRFVGVHGRKAK